MSRLEKDSELVSAVLFADGLSLKVIKANRQAIQMESNIINTLLKYDDTYIVVSGSRGDGLGLNYGYGRTDKSSDLDLVAVYKHKVVEEGADTSGAMIIKETDKESPGYVRLNLIASNPFLTFCKQVNKKLYLSSTKWMGKQDGEQFRARISIPYKLHGPAAEVSLSNSAITVVTRAEYLRDLRYTDPAFNVKSSTGLDDTDVLVCFESKTWPCEANEWLTRKRPSGWPGKTLIQSVSRTGCILAPVNSKDSPNKDIQWRICSNKGESILVASFNVTQFHCYFLLKMFNAEVLKQASGKNLTSYIMKTLMFWMSEEIPASEWRPERLISCFIKSMNKLKEWIADRFLPNYFIVGRNMFIMTDFPDDVAKRTIYEIEQICADPIQEIQKTELLKLKFDESTDELHLRGLYMQIQNWMNCRRAMADTFYFLGNKVINSAHIFTDTEKSLENCEMALGELLNLGGYYKPMSDLLSNSIGVLRYAFAVKCYAKEGSNKSTEDYSNLMTDNELSKILKEEGKRLRKMRPEDIYAANQIFENSKMVDFSHSPLRIATCLLLDKQYDRALELVGESMRNMHEKSKCLGHSHYRTVSDKLFDAACDSVMNLKVANNVSMLKKLYSIMDRDIETENLEETMETLEQHFPEIYDAFAEWWDCAVFDVIFSSAEMKVLPKALQNEGAMNAAVPYTVPIPGSSFPAFPFRRAFILTLHPQVYLWYLRFLVNFGKTHNTDQTGADKVLESRRESIFALLVLNDILERGTHVLHKELRPNQKLEDQCIYRFLSDAQLPTSAEHLIVGYNLLVFSYVQLGAYQEAANYLLKSMLLSWENPASGENHVCLDSNVAYYYFRIIVKALLEIDFKDTQ